jgi:hypothetical protein
MSTPHLVHELVDIVPVVSLECAVCAVLAGMGKLHKNWRKFWSRDMADKEVEGGYLNRGSQRTTERSLPSCWTSLDRK